VFEPLTSFRVRFLNSADMGATRWWFCQSWLWPPRHNVEIFRPLLNPLQSNDGAVLQADGNLHNCRTTAHGDTPCCWSTVALKLYVSRTYPNCLVMPSTSKGDLKVSTAVPFG
jgi:hypothetical protein